MIILSVLKRLTPALAAVGLLANFGAARSAEPPVSKLEGHRSNLAARLVLSNGLIRTVALDGVGCSASMCSRVAVNTRSTGDVRFTKTWLDSIAAIRDITEDAALFVFKDGTQRRLSVNSDNRVLYLADRAGKIDLLQIQSLEFIGAR